MSLAVLLSIAATAPTAAVASPPPIVTVAPPPPMISAPALPSRTVGPAVTFDVEIRLGDEILWTGPMRVAEGAQAQFTRTKNDAPTTQCTDPILRYGGTDTSSLSVRLSRLASRTGEDRFQLTATWSRPGIEKGCSMEQGTRTIGLTQTLTIANNGDLTVHGDGGLAVRLRRR